MKVETKVEKITKTVVQEEQVYVLTLNQKEAEILLDLTGQVIGGGPARKVTDQIYYDLGDNGIEKSDRGIGKRKCNFNNQQVRTVEN